ncbi:MAG: hypothetical protein ACMXYK_05010 [Candidatus Woesearchaeota archaeon]
MHYQANLERYAFEILPKGNTRELTTYERKDTVFYPAIGCDSSFERHLKVLSPNKSHYREGYLIYLEDELLGHIKIYKEPSFLLWKDINEHLRKGSLFCLEDSITSYLKESFIKSYNTWNSIYLSHIVLERIKPGTKEIRTAINAEFQRIMEIQNPSR